MFFTKNQFADFSHRPATGTDPNPVTALMSGLRPYGLLRQFNENFLLKFDFLAN